MSRNMMQRIRWQLRGVMLLTLFVLLMWVVSAQDQPVFRIGVLAEAESELALGAQLRVNQFNAAGGVAGADGTRFRLELVYAPTNGGLNTAAAIQELATANVIAVLAPSDSQEIATTLPLLTQLGVPIMTHASGDGLIVSDTSGLLFRVGATDFLISRGMADYLINTLRLSNIQILQFDAESTVNSLGFQTAAVNFGIAIASPQIINTPDLVSAGVQAILAAPPDALVAFGDPVLAGQMYAQLRGSGYAGVFVYPEISHPDFVAQFPFDTLKAGLIGTTSWSYAAEDRESTVFLAEYVRAYGEIPTSDAAAAADMMTLLQNAIGLPGELRNNLLSLRGVSGVQGILSPIELNPGETSANVLLYDMTVSGGVTTLARYLGDTMLPQGSADFSLLGTPTPVPTATPDGVVANILSDVQNVRGGPSTDFDILGQLRQGDQVQIVGSTGDYNWLVIDFRGQEGWIANLPNLNDVFGDLNTVPLVTPPPTPTPAATSTAAPPQEADIVIQSASVVPNPILPNNSFTITAVVANVGRSNAGTFSVAMTMPPNNVLVSATVASLAAGQTTNVTLTGTLQNTGSYAAVLVADLNNQVPEGVGESNNDDFTYNYRIDRALISSGSTTANGGDTISLSGAVLLNWDGTNFNAVGGQIGALNVTYENVHYDLISTTTANVGSLTPVAGSVVGVRNSDGKRGALRVDSISGSTITVTYKSYD